MPVLRPPFDDSQLPTPMRKLPKDHRGFPIPYFVATLPDGSQDLRLASEPKRHRACRDKLCWVCGDHLGPNFAFAGGPMSAMNHCFGDWAMHLACARFAAQACPFINGTAKRRTANDQGEELPGSIREPMPWMVLYITSGVVRMSHAGHFLAPPASKIEWYAQGEQINPKGRGDILAYLSGFGVTAKQAKGIGV